LNNEAAQAIGDDVRAAREHAIDHHDEIALRDLVGRLVGQRWLVEMDLKCCKNKPLS
jgi:hypothetical protein